MMITRSPEFGFALLLIGLNAADPRLAGLLMCIWSIRSLCNLEIYRVRCALLAFCCVLLQALLVWRPVPGSSQHIMPIWILGET